MWFLIEFLRVFVAWCETGFKSFSDLQSRSQNRVYFGQECHLIQMGGIFSLERV